jgi:hypothetical protein
LESQTIDKCSGSIKPKGHAQDSQNGREMFSSMYWDHDSDVVKKTESNGEKTSKMKRNKNENKS